jgi:hypothetical protein
VYSKNFFTLAIICPIISSSKSHFVKPTMVCLVPTVPTFWTHDWGRRPFVVVFCSDWPKPKLITKFTFNTHPPHKILSQLPGYSGSVVNAIIPGVVLFLATMSSSRSDEVRPQVSKFVTFLCFLLKNMSHDPYPITHDL